MDAQILKIVNSFSSTYFLCRNNKVGYEEPTSFRVQKQRKGRKRSLVCESICLLPSSWASEIWLSPAPVGRGKYKLVLADYICDKKNDFVCVLGWETIGEEKRKNANAS